MFAESELRSYCLSSMQPGMSCGTFFERIGRRKWVWFFYFFPSL